MCTQVLPCPHDRPLPEKPFIGHLGYALSFKTWTLLLCHGGAS